MKTRFVLLALGIVLIARLFFLPSIQPVGAGADEPKSRAAVPIEKQLATLQTVNSDPPQILIEEFDVVLTRLERKCSQTRLSSLSLGDIAVASTKMLAYGGKTTTLSQFLQALDDSIPDGSPAKVGRLNCADIAALLVSTMGGKTK